MPENAKSLIKNSAMKIVDIETVVVNAQMRKDRKSVV